MHSVQFSQSEAALPTCSVRPANQMQGHLHMGGRVWEHAFHISSSVWEYHGGFVG